jgi:hypothetical protein
MEAPEAALVTCKECHQIGHRAGTCLTKHTCSRCGDKEHKPSECKCLGSDRAMERRHVKCKRCNNFGHKAKGCPGIHCSYCKGPHAWEACPNANCPNCPELPLGQLHWKKNCSKRRPATSAAVITLRNTARFLSLVICWLEREFWTAILQQALH